MSSGSAPRPALSSLFLLLGALCLGVLVRSFGPAFLSACFRPVPILELPGLLALIAGLSSAVVLHEAGHLLAALANNFEVSGMVLGPFRFVRLGASWSLTLKANRLFEASVSAFPKTQKDWRSRMMMVVAAGPLATLLTGIVTVLSLHAHGGADNWFTWFLRVFAQVSFFIFVLGLVPNHPSLLSQNDAALLRSLWRMDSQANEMFLYHLVLQQQRMGIKPRSYSPNLMQRLAQFKGRPDFMAFFATTIASWAFDSNDMETGNTWDRQALNLCPRCGASSRHLAVVNSVCFDIIYRKNLVAARTKLSTLDTNKIVSPYLHHRAMAAIHLTARRTREALAEIAAARFTLPKHLQSSGVEYLLLSRLHAVILSIQPEDFSVKTQQLKSTPSQRVSSAAI